MIQKISRISSSVISFLISSILFPYFLVLFFWISYLILSFDMFILFTIAKLRMEHVSVGMATQGG
jgi:hypothetical protein